VSGYTPGPWKWHVENQHEIEMQAGGYHLASLWAREVAAIYDEEPQANARLIAAAPYLLISLYTVAAMAEGLFEATASPSAERIAEEARAAIRLAEGGSDD
jgi:hypothetical protein